LHQIQDAIEPAISLKRVLAHWNWLAATLAENHRQRIVQSRNPNNDRGVQNYVA
jgi:hypothetical protein